MTDETQRLCEQLLEKQTVGFHDDGFASLGSDGSYVNRPSTPMTRPFNRDGAAAKAQIETLLAENRALAARVEATLAILSDSSKPTPDRVRDAKVALSPQRGQ